MTMMKMRKLICDFRPSKFSHYPSRPVPLPEDFVTTRPDPVPKSKTTTRQSLLLRAILETCDIWDIDYNSDNWEPEFMTIFVAWQLIVTLDSIRNSCDVFANSPNYSDADTRCYVCAKTAQHLNWLTNDISVQFFTNGSMFPWLSSDVHLLCETSQLKAFK